MKTVKYALICFILTLLLSGTPSAQSQAAGLAKQAPVKP